MPSDRITAIEWDIIQHLDRLESTFTSIASSLAAIATAVAAPPDACMGSIQTCANLLHKDLHDLLHHE